MNQPIKKAIDAIDDDAWTSIEYTDAIMDEASGRWISRSEVAEIGFTTFAAQKKPDRVPGRLIVLRIPDFNAEKNKTAGQDTLFAVWRFHAFFTTTAITQDSSGTPGQPGPADRHALSHPSLAERDHTVINRPIGGLSLRPQIG